MNSIIPDPDVLEDKQSPHQPVDGMVGSFEVQNTNSLVFAPENQLRGGDTVTILAHPTANNGGSPAWAFFMDLIAGPDNITVTQMSTASTAGAGATFSVEIFTRTGTALGGPVGSGPGSSPAGWTLLDTVPVTQGPVASGTSLVFSIPPISISAGDTVGVAVRFIGAGPRYFGTGTPPYSVFSDTTLTLVTGDGRSVPFTPTGSFFTSRALTGEIRYVVDAPPPSGNSLCFNRTGVNLALPDNTPAGVNDTIKVPNNMGTLDDITVVVDNITHTWIGDLTLRLSHGGETDTVISRIGTGTF
ncbi:MAG TPA: hypothetical protein VK004_03460, partial [Ignavibacteria bacterium]|nr:hypothetical protein [Ignavibacteria bacterium]